MDRSEVERDISHRRSLDAECLGHDDTKDVDRDEDDEFGVFHKKSNK